MTLLIVFLSITNLAIGYGLAIYLGHARLPGNAAPLPARPQPTPMPVPAPAATAPQAPLQPEPVASPAAEVTNTVALEEKPVDQFTEPKAAPAPEPKVDVMPLVPDSPASAPVEETPELVAAKMETPTEASTEIAAEQPATDSSLEEQTLQELESFREQLLQQAESPATESVSDDARPVEETASESADEEAPQQEPKELNEQELLQGIGAFKEQLQKQHELSKIN